jgi:hypothetical protein
MAESAAPDRPASDAKIALASEASRLSRFDEERQKLRRAWVGHAIAPGHIWRRTSPNERSDSRPFNVIDDVTGRTGKAKPGELGLSDVPRAAHEKIIADLATVLDLPVPPATLYDRGDTAKADQGNDKNEKIDSPRYVSVSAWAFDSCDSLQLKIQKFTADQLQSLVAPFSAMTVFETWISAGNAHLGHVLVDNNCAADEPVPLAWVDHAYSLSQQWTSDAANPNAVGWYLPNAKADRDVQQRIIEGILSVPNEKITEIVTRVGADWLDAVRRDRIINKLIDRKTNILKLCGLS